MVRPSFIKGLIEERMTIKDWIIEILWYNNFTCFLRKLGRFILRLIRWLPVLYKQEEWDFGYIYDILEMKMKELRKSISQDTWHTEQTVKRSLAQINVCLTRLDRFRNWDNYIEIPKIKYEEQENGTPLLVLKDPEYDKAILEGIDFERKNYEKFWKDFVRWHNNWWT